MYVNKSEPNTGSVAHQHYRSTSGSSSLHMQQQRDAPLDDEHEGEDAGPHARLTQWRVCRARRREADPGGAESSGLHKARKYNGH